MIRLNSLLNRLNSLSPKASWIGLFLLGTSSFSLAAAEPAPLRGESNGIALEWSLASENLKLKITCPTTGWLAVGLYRPGFTLKEHLMEGANILIGYLDNEGNVKIRDDYGNTMFSHREDAKLNGKDHIVREGLLAPKGSVKDGSTTIEFAIPLDSGDVNDAPIVPGTEHEVILACGPEGAKNFVDKHRRVGTLKIKIPSNVNPEK